MANELARLFVVLGIDDSELQTKLKSVQRTMVNLGQMAIYQGAALTGAMGFAIKAAEDERVNIARLDAQLKNVGVSYGEVKTELEGVIQATMRKTGVADDEQRDMLGRLLLITKDYKAALSLLPISLDLAAAGEMDSTTAATRLGKAWIDLQNGAKNVTVQLGRTSIVVKDLAELQRMLAGAAAAASSPLQTLKNTAGDLYEAIGGTLLPVVKDFVDGITPVIDKVRTWIEANPELSSSLAKVALGVGGLLTVFGALTRIMPGLIAQFLALNALIGPIGWVTLAVAAVGVTIGLTSAFRDLNTEIGQTAAVVGHVSDTMTAQTNIADKNVMAFNALVNGADNARIAHNRLVPVITNVTEELKGNKVAIAEVTWEEKGATLTAQVFTQAEIDQQRALGRTVVTTQQAKDAAEALKNQQEESNATMDRAKQAAEDLAASQERLAIMTGRIVAGTKDMQQSIGTATWQANGATYSMSLYTDAELEAAEAAGKKVSKLESQNDVMDMGTEAARKATDALTGFVSSEKLTEAQSTATQKQVAQLLTGLQGTEFGSSKLFFDMMNNIKTSGLDTMTLITGFMKQWAIESGNGADSTKDAFSSLLDMINGMPTEKQITILLRYVTTGQMPGTTTQQPTIPQASVPFIPDFTSPTTPILPNPGTIGSSPWPEYAMGTPYVPRTGLALIHEGERITPAGQNVAPTVNNFYMTVQGSISAEKDFVSRMRTEFIKIMNQNAKQFGLT